MIPDGLNPLDWLFETLLFKWLIVQCIPIAQVLLSTGFPKLVLFIPFAIVFFLLAGLAFRARSWLLIIAMAAWGLFMITVLEAYSLLV